ncbi:SGNH/GDSL hydrolase family protein [Pedobacter metabolipauper]|uniref:Lysophospholipase L1-like esterase n=1 Tax=Pedobacter metabolipauper TaxID=425513 RepID=A0A4R6SSW5_9SPHI|nr:SGNH/GDSL hydrolase family protein [Pedobacter metabolipauper]TDQ08078.1 lysophospholipase L1-like esterase [Pedobacter metabolipauper]
MNTHRRGFLRLGLLASAVILGSKDLLASSAEDNSVLQPDEEKITVSNAGVGGNNTADLLGRIEKDCLSLKPKLTILMAGTNDMNSVKHIPLGDYEKNLDTMAQMIIRSRSKLLMMTILPAYEPDLLTRHPAAFYEPDGVSGRRKQVNDAIKRVAKRHKAGLLDLGLRFEAIGKIGAGKDSLIQNEANSNKRDGIHPTANGYRFIGLSVYDHITSHKLPQSGIVCFGDSITKGDGSIERDSYPAYLKKLLSTS